MGDDGDGNDGICGLILVRASCLLIQAALESVSMLGKDGFFFLYNIRRTDL